jgi:hypothetical protein
LSSGLFSLKLSALESELAGFICFVNFILSMYVRNGFKELGLDKLGTLIDMKYHSIADAKQQLKMDPREMRNFFLDLQKDLYNGEKVINVTIENHYHGNIDQLTINSDK